MILFIDLIDSENFEVSDHCRVQVFPHSARRLEVEKMVFLMIDQSGYLMNKIIIPRRDNPLISYLSCA